MARLRRARTSWPAVMVLVTVYIFAVTAGAAVVETCLNGCSGHGACSNFVCSCESGFDGEDCRYALLRDVATLPVLSAGAYNVTSPAAFEALRRRTPLFVVGFSSSSCAKCAAFEPAYAAAAAALRDGVPFVRVNAAQQRMRATARESGVAAALPALVVFRSGRAVPYHGAHVADDIVEFVRKLRAPVAAALLATEVSFLLFTVIFHANHAHNLTHSP